MMCILPTWNVATVDWGWFGSLRHGWGEVCSDAGAFEGEWHEGVCSGLGMHQSKALPLLLCSPPTFTVFTSHTVILHPSPTLATQVQTISSRSLMCFQDREVTYFGEVKNGRNEVPAITEAD